MTAHAWLVVGYTVAFAGLSLFVLPHWCAQQAEEGQTVADCVAHWWHRYRSYRKVVSGEYSRHDGTQHLRSNRRYCSPRNPAPPAIPPVVFNPWFGQPMSAPPAQGRHLALVS